MITADLKAEITKQRDTETPAGLVLSLECIASHEGRGNALWTLWRRQIGLTGCGCEIRCAIVREGGDWEEETESQGFTGIDCPIEWLSRTQSEDFDWRDRAWREAERKLAAE